MINKSAEKLPAIDLCRNAQGEHALVHFDDIRISKILKSESGLLIFGSFDPVTIETDSPLIARSIEAVPVSRATMSVGEAYELAISR